MTWFVGHPLYSLFVFCGRPSAGFRSWRFGLSSGFAGWRDMDRDGARDGERETNHDKDGDKDRARAREHKAKEP